MSYKACDIGVRQKGDTVKVARAANKLIKQIQNNPITMKYESMGDLEKCQLICYSDASFRNLPNEGSQGGFIIFLVSQSNVAVPILWQSKKIRRIVRSTLAAETLSMAEAAEATYLLRNM